MVLKKKQKKKKRRNQPVSLNSDIPPPGLEVSLINRFIFFFCIVLLKPETG